MGWDLIIESPNACRKVTALPDRTITQDGFRQTEQRQNRAGLALGLAGTAACVIILGSGLVFLARTDLPKLLTALIAVLWVGGGLTGLYFALDKVCAHVGRRTARVLQPAMFVGPALLMIFYFLAFPTVRTVYASLFNHDGSAFVGLANYVRLFTEPFMLVTFRNNLLWLIFGAGFTTVFGLAIAALADRSRYENYVKAIIFMPMAISLVGAGIVWKFIYAYRDASLPQIGVLNALYTGAGGQPQAWIALLQPWNNLFLIVIVVWLQTGYAMVLFSAAIKAVPSDVLEAASMDGASELRAFWSVTLPMIRNTVIAVSATVTIFTLKIFDIVLVMTGGEFGTDVLATQFYTQYFIHRDFGLGSAIAVVLLLAVTPVIVYNLRSIQRSDER